MFFIAGFLYVSHIPERIWPNRFDFFGHSHQFFHIAAVLSSFFQFKALREDMNGLIIVENVKGFNLTYTESSINSKLINLNYVQMITFYWLLINFLIFFNFYIKVRYFNPWTRK